MSARVFWCETIAVGEQILNPEESRHAAASLRLESGDAIIVLNGRGLIGRGIVLSRADRRRPAQLHVKIERVDAVPAPARRLTLIVAACKGERLDWLVEKCTELGVDRLWFAEFQRSAVEPDENRLERLERLARQACKQCRRAWMPEIRGVRPLSDAIDAWRAQAGEPLFVAHPDPAAPALGAALRSGARASREAAVVVGPEGGLSAGEVEELQQRGAQLVRLADQILRVETAALAAACAWADACSD